MVQLNFQSQTLTKKSDSTRKPPTPYDSATLVATRLFEYSRIWKLQRHEALVDLTKLYSSQRAKSLLNSEMGFLIFCMCHLQFFNVFVELDDKHTKDFSCLHQMQGFRDKRQIFLNSNSVKYYLGIA